MNEAVRIGKQSVKPPAETMTGVIAELGALLAGKKTLAAARGISRAALDSLYCVTRDLYACGHRAEASSCLALLCLYDHENTRFWQALGTCRQANQDHVGAAAAFAFAIGQCSEFDGSLEMQLIESLVAAGQVNAARARLHAALEAAEENRASEPWHEQARRLQARVAESAASQ